MGNLFQELQRRKVLKVAGIYLVVAWLALQIADVVVPALFLPDWSVSLVLYLLIFAFPLVLLLSWHFDLTTHGFKQDSEDSARGLKGLKAGIILAIAFLSVGAAGVLLYSNLSEPSDSEQVAELVPENSIAVLRFSNESDDPDQQYFSDGISDELINALARLPGLHVVARTSTFQVEGSLANADVGHIAQLLGVRTLLEGSVRRIGDSVRVTAKLVDADGFQMWSESYDGEITEIFAIEDEIAASIADAMRGQLSLEESIDPAVTRAASIDAYNLYLLGRSHFEKRTVAELGEAQRYFEAAIERDPNFAPAYNSLSDTILLRSVGSFGFQPREQQIAAALPLIEKSLQLDPMLAETHASLGFLRLSEGDLLASEAALKRAIDLNPNSSIAYNWLYITYEGLVQQRDAFETLQRALALDPLSPIINANMGAELWNRSRNDDALMAANRILQVAPDISLGYNRSGRFKWTTGEMAEAVDWYRQSIEIAPEDRNSKLELGALLVDLGFFEEAEELLGNERYIAYLAQDRFEEARAVVNAAWEERPEQLNTIFPVVLTEARAGNFNRVRELLEPLVELTIAGEVQIFRRSGIHHWDFQIAAMDLAVARIETGDQESGLSLLSEVRDHFELLSSMGIDFPILSFQHARIAALEGRLDEALENLRVATMGGFRFWYLDGDPALKSLLENPEFRVIIDNVNLAVEEERAKLVESSRIN